MSVKIILGEHKPTTLFSDIADLAAKQIKDNSDNGKKNKTTQLRKFYDELAMWNERVQSKIQNKEQAFKELEPFIRMLKAKVAYAQGRDHIDASFRDIFNQTIDQVKSAETLNEAKLFMEAVIGFYKLYE